MTFDEQAEYEALTSEQKRMVEQAIADCRSHGAMANIWESADHAYAYPHRDGIAWGINGGEHGWCIARGIRR